MFICFNRSTFPNADVYIVPYRIIDISVKNVFSYNLNYNDVYSRTLYSDILNIMTTEECTVYKFLVVVTSVLSLLHVYFNTVLVRYTYI